MKPCANAFTSSPRKSFSFGVLVGSSRGFSFPPFFMVFIDIYFGLVHGKFFFYFSLSFFFVFFFLFLLFFSISNSFLLVLAFYLFLPFSVSQFS